MQWQFYRSVGHSLPDNLIPNVPKSANDAQIFSTLSESPLKIKNIAILGFLTLFLVPELLRSKDLKDDLTLVYVGGGGRKPPLPA